MEYSIHNACPNGSIIRMITNMVILSRIVPVMYYRSSRYTSSAQIA